MHHVARGGTLQWLSFAVVVAAQLAPAPEARACGCLVMPDPSQPIVQAGERIVFAVKNSIVTAQIQIKYQGDPKDFGWLLPLPSLPTLELGSDELFSQLEAKTAPQFFLKTMFASNCGSSGGVGLGCASDGVASIRAPTANGGAADMGQAHSALVVQDSIGPYYLGVLKADNKDEMLNWLTANHYLVPAGTDAVVAPYIHSGAYFLALKLKSGKSNGDIQPVVVHYASDLPMIPIVLTSVGATPNMGIEVFVLGAGRAIPRNYNHTVLNDAALDWNNFGQSYASLVNAAVLEAPKHHTFITEFAGSTVVMQNVLDPQGRFGDPSVLKTITDAEQYADYLRDHDFKYPFSGPLAAVLQAYLPEPAGFVDAGISPSQFYGTLDQQLRWWRETKHQPPLAVDAAKLTDDIWARVVTPTLAAGALFIPVNFPFMTRLFTTLSPADMTEDPVFSFNPALPNVSNVHTATMQLDCNGDGLVTTPEGFQVPYPNAVAGPETKKISPSLRIETLTETGDPTIQVDNQHQTLITLGQTNGCNVTLTTTNTTGSRTGARTRARTGMLLLLTLSLTLAVRARRKTPPNA